MKNANKFLNNVSLYFTLEPVKPSIESNLHLLERMELLFMLQKRLNRNGTSENSEKERMKNSGNDGLIFIQRIFLHIYFYSIKIILFHFKKVDFSQKKKQYIIIWSHFMILSLTIALPKMKTIKYLFVLSIVIFTYLRMNQCKMSLI